MRVLFFGLGGVGQRHLRNILSLVPDAQFAAVRHKGRTFEIGNDLRANYEVDIMEKYAITLFANLRDAAKFSPDFAVVSTPTSTHLETSLELVKHRIPVFLEKPISSEETGLDELLEVAAALEVPVMVGYMLRFHPGIQALKSLIDARRIGRFYCMQVVANSYMPYWHEYEQYNEFYVGSRTLGGGAVLTEVHEIDLLDWFFGQPRNIWVVGGKMSKLDIDVEDTACCLLEQELDGSQFGVLLYLSYVQRPIRRTITLFGDKGTIEWDLHAPSLTVRDQENLVDTVSTWKGFERNSMFLKEMEHFIQCLAQKKEPLCSLRKVVSGHKTALRIRQLLEGSGSPAKPGI